MPRTSYCTHLDVIRKFDPAITQADLDNNDYVGNDDEEVIKSRIGGVEADFEAETGHALREVRVGSVGAPASYEAHENKYWKRTPSKVYLDHRQIHPIDAAEGDKIELRTSRDSWKDITGDEGDRWAANYRKGVLEVYSRLRSTARLRNIRDERFIRLTYRYGGLGGSANEGGQTELAESVSSTDTGAVSVADASRLPANASILLLGGEEYVRVSSVDTSNDEVNFDDRGKRLTQAADWGDGTVVHYCPISVREAIAAKAARELVLFDDYVDQQRATEIDGSEKIDQWQKEYDKAVARYQEMHYG